MNILIALYRFVLGIKTIPACDGSRFIWDQKAVFPHSIDNKFRELVLDKSPRKTPETNVQPKGMVVDTQFEQMPFFFGKNLKKLCFTQDQILAFCEKNPSYFSPSGPMIYFLLHENFHFYAVRVSAHPTGLGVNVSQLFERISVRPMGPPIFLMVPC